MSSFTASFARPVPEFHPVPWWAWTGRLAKPEMRRQLDEMLARGIYEFFIFPLYGLEYPLFLRESWFEYVGFTLAECRQRGMKVWIYDELNWPSGTAGGRAVREHPEYRSWHLCCQEVELPPGETYYLDAAVQVVAAFWKDGDGTVLTPMPARVNDVWKNGTGRPGTLLLVLKKTSNGSSFNCNGLVDSWGQRGQLDLLNPDAFRAWMGYIHEQYYERFREEFGQTLKGFFFDEPQTHAYQDFSVPWTPRLPGLFRERYGYDLVPELPRVFLDLPGSARVRSDYWRLVAELFGDHLRLLSGWCAERGVLLTGHMIFEEVVGDMRQAIARNGDIHVALRSVPVPGMDLLGCNTSFAMQRVHGRTLWYRGGASSLVMTAKRISATARYSGASRTMCEAFGVRPFTADLAEQKVINDWLAAMGINLINDNTLIYTIADFRKRTGAGKHFTQPWWGLYGLFAECSARLSQFAASGRLETGLAVLYPQTTHTAATPMGPGEPAPLAGHADAFNRTLDALVRRHLEFEMLFEDMLTAGEAVATGGVMAAPASRFNVVVLPHVLWVTPAVATVLAAFAEGGGRLVAVDTVPQVIGGGDLAGVSEVIASSHHDFKSRLAAAVAAAPQPAYAITGAGAEDVVTALRRNDDGDALLLVANQLPGDRTLTLTHRLGAVTELLDPDSGAVCALPMTAVDGGFRQTFILAENQSFIFRMGVGPTPGARPLATLPTVIRTGEQVVLDLGRDWRFQALPENHFLPPQETCLDPLDRGLVEEWPRTGGVGEPEMWQPVLGQSSPFSVCRAESEYYWLRGDFELQAVPADLSLVVDDESCLNVFVNGVEIREWSPAALWDQSNRRYALAGACRPGRNRFHVRVRTSFWNQPQLGLMAFTAGNIMPVALAGSFIVLPDNRLAPPPATVQAGAWNEQGYPFFAGTGVYRQAFVLSQLPVRPVLEVADAGVTVEASINGHDLPARAWRPFRFDLEDRLCAGENHLELRIRGGFGNLIRRFYASYGETRPYGLLGEVRILSRG